MARKKTVVLGVVGGTLSVLLIAVLALGAWVLFRPLMSGDYNHTYGDIRTADELSQNPLAAMAASVGQPRDAESAEALGNRIANTVEQIDVVRESVDGARESRAGKKDSSLAAQLKDLDEAYAHLSKTFAAWHEDDYPHIAYAARQCLGESRDDCRAAVETLSDTSPDDPALAEVVSASEKVAQGAGRGALDGAVDGLAERVEKLWEPIPSQLAEITAYLGEHGEIDR